MAKISEVLKDAKAYIIKHDWCQQEEEAKDGSVCCVGAIRKVAPTKTDGCEIIDFFAQYIDPWFEPKYDFGHEIVASWNDWMGTTKKDVLKAFDKAIEGAVEFENKRGKA